MAACVAQSPHECLDARPQPVLSHARGSSLSEAIAVADDRSSQLRGKRAKAAQAAARAEMQWVRTGKDRLNQLHDEIGRIGKRAADLEELHESSLRASEALRLSACKAVTRAEDAVRAREVALGEYQARQRELQEQKAQVEDQRCAFEETFEQVDRFLRLYEDRLGLVINRIAPRTVRVTLTSIHERDMLTEHTFVLAVAQAEPVTYSVSDCQPTVPQLPSLLARLNKDATAASALSSFICGMRRAFEESAR